MRYLLLTIVLFLPATALADFTLVTWNMKHLGRKSLDIEKAVHLMSPEGGSPDMITIQEVNSTKSGATALAALAAALKKKSGQRYCSGLSEIPTDARERYAYLWRESSLSYVTTAGKEVPSCSDFAITIRLGTKHAAKIIREPAIGFFKEKATGVKLLIATIHHVPTAKKPQNEAPLGFASVDEVAGKGPRIFTGDFNLGTNHSVFTAVFKRGYQAALGPGMKTSIKKSKREFSQPYDNIFYQGVRVSGARVLSAFTVFPNMSGLAVNKELSDHMPVWAKIETKP